MKVYPYCVYHKWVLTDHDFSSVGKRIIDIKKCKKKKCRHLVYTDRHDDTEYLKYRIELAKLFL